MCSSILTLVPTHPDLYHLLAIDPVAFSLCSKDMITNNINNDVIIIIELSVWWHWFMVLRFQFIHGDVRKDCICGMQKCIKIIIQSKNTMLLVAVHMTTCVIQTEIN